MAAPRTPHPSITRGTWSPIAVAAITAALVTVALAAVDSATRLPVIWATTNVVAWEIDHWRAPALPPTTTTTLRGTVRDAANRPLEGATAVVALPDGTALEARTTADGAFAVDAVPIGVRTVWIGAVGFASVTQTVTIDAAATPSSISVSLAPIARAAMADPAVARLRARDTVHHSDAVRLTCDAPVAATALRWEITAPRLGLGAGQALGYRPDPDVPRLDTASIAPDADRFGPPAAPPDAGARPPLLVVYPGPAASWECASIPLAAAGFEVVAYGPPYGFEVESEVDRLRLLMATLGDRPAILAGSYSAIHALRLVQDAPAGSLAAVVLMGPPVDLFDLRRRLEVEGWVPPFGLDRALIALGRPDREVARHARYSARLHIGPTHPPTLVIHARSDEVVPVAQGEAYLRALSDAGVAAVGMITDGGGHYLLAPGGEAAAILAQTVAFLGGR